MSSTESKGRGTTRLRPLDPGKWLRAVLAIADVRKVYDHTVCIDKRIRPGALVTSHTGTGTTEESESESDEERRSVD